MKKLTLVQILLSLLLSSCMAQPMALQPSQPVSRLADPKNAPLGCSQDPLSTQPWKTGERFVANLNTLGTELYHRLTQTDQSANLIFSPYGVASAFAVAYAGARQETAVEMANYLHFLPQADQHTQFYAVNCYLISLANQDNATKEENGEANILFQLQLTNGLWRQTGFPFSEHYIATIAQHYDAALQSVDFVANPTQAVQQINQWVDQQTAGRIQEIVTDNEVTVDTRLVIANAIYFKASWLHPFLPTQTQPQEFTLHDGTTVVTPLMHGFIRAPYLQAHGYQAALLPYVGEGVDLLLLIPDLQRFTEIEQTLDPATLSTIAADAQLHDITLALPKFTVQNKVDLRKTLQAAGLHTPFDPVKANFNGMTDRANDLYISAALQQATITVDEKGTEAAAATGVVMAVAGIERAELIVDRPFIYAIWAREAKAILFMGRVMNPTE